MIEVDAMHAGWTPRRIANWLESFFFSGSILLFCGHEMNVKNNFARFQSFCVTVDLLTIHLQWFYNSAEYLKLEAWSEIWFPFNSPVGCVLPRK